MNVALCSCTLFKLQYSHAKKPATINIIELECIFSNVMDTF